MGPKKDEFAWTRTQDPTIRASVGLTNMKLIDDKTKEDMAVYLQNHLKSWKKMGTFVIFKDSGRKWCSSFFVTLLVPIE